MREPISGLAKKIDENMPLAKKCRVTLSEMACASAKITGALKINEDEWKIAINKAVRRLYER